MLDAATLQQRARAATNAGRHVQAASLARRGLDRSPSPVERARLLATLAYAEAELGHLDLADALCADALVEPGLDATTRGTVHGQRAVVSLRRGRRTQALAEFGAAIRSLESDPADLGRNLLNRGNLHLEEGDPRRALADFERALAESRVAGLEGQAAKARHNAGYAAFLLGDQVRALTDMDAVQPYLAAQSPTMHAVGLQDRAEVLAASGLREDAIADLTRAIALFRMGGAKRAEASALLVLARILAVDDPRTGLRLARRASARFAAMGADLSRLRADVAAALCARATLLPRIPDAAPLAAALRERGLTEEAGHLALAECSWLLGRGRPDEAAAVRLPRSTRRRPQPWASLVAAERQAALGHRAAALRHVRGALDDLLTVQATLGSLELQTSLSNAAARMGRLGLGLALQRGDPGTVLEWSERTRAASSRVSSPRPPDDADVAADLTELRTLAAFGRDPDRQDALRHRIRERAWRAHGSRAAQPVCTLPEATEALAARDATLIALLAGDDHAHALVVVAGGATLVPLGPLAPIRTLLDGLPADLDVSAADLPPRLAEGVRAGLTHRLGHLDALVLAPLAGLLEAQRVVLTPSGLFAHVPWPLLPSLAGRPVAVARSATAWTLAPDAPPPTRTLLVAGPDVQRAEAEVRACAAHWDAPAVLTGPDAGVRRVALASTRAELAHIAAHGRHHAENPLFSHVRLADGPAFGYDLDRVSPLPGVMVLSACDLGNRSTSDDPVGLATALLHAGVRTVLASPAALSDEAAATLMPDLHRHLAVGVPAMDALAGSLVAYGAGAPPLVCFGAGW